MQVCSHARTYARMQRFNTPYESIRFVSARSFDVKERSASSSIFLALAGKKLVRFQEYAALYPEATFVFVGDNGQARIHCFWYEAEL